MSVIGSNVLAGASGGAGAAGYKIERSLRFNSSDSAYLNKNFGSAGNRKTWTWSGWVKRSSLGSRQHVFGAVSSGSSFSSFEFNADDELRFYDNTLGDSNAIVFETTRVFRDPGAWQHLVLALDSTAGTDQIKLYVNGVRETSFSTGPTVASNGEGLTNSNNVGHNIGSWTPASSSLNLNAYLAEIYFIDGQALDQFSFGEFDNNGVWQPKEFTPSTEYSTTAITSVTALNTSFTTDAGTAYAFGSGNIDEGTYDRKTNGAVLDVTLSPAQSGNFVVYTGAINETSNYTIVFEYSDGTTETVLNNSTSTRNGPGNTCTVNVGQKSNVVGFTVDCQDNNDSQLCGVTVDGTRLVTNQAYGKQVTLTDGTNLDQFPVNTVVSNGDKVIARDTTNNTLSLDGTSWAAGQYVTKGGYGTNGFYLDFSDNSNDSALGTDSSGKSNTWTVTGINATAPLNIGPFSAANAYTGTTSNNYGVSDGSWNSAFDGSIHNGVYHVNQSGETILTMVNSASWSSQIRIRRQLMGGNSDGHVKLNNTEITGGSSSNQWIDVTNTMGTSGTLTSVGVKDSHRLFAIELDGEILTDSASAARVDSLIDTPTNYEADSANNGGNYATLNPLALGDNITLSNGNLHASEASTSGHTWAKSTIGVKSGKWYVEVTVESATGPNNFGLTNYSRQHTGWIGTDGSAVNQFNIVYNNGSSRTILDGNVAMSQTISGSQWTVGDVLQFAYDADNGKAWFGINNTWYQANGSSTTLSAVEAGTNATFVNFAYDSEYFFTTDHHDAAFTHNYGQRAFKYTPPTGFLSLCTTNLVDPTIADGSNHFDTKTWDGNNSSTNSTPRNVDTYKFSPDLVWIKNKNSTEPHNFYDTVRGEGKYLYPHDYNQENDAGSYGLTGFLSNGFSLLDQGPGYWSVNANTRTYVGWAWDGGDLATNSAYNQSQAWSSGTSTNPTQGSWANVFASSFSSSWADGTDAWVYNASATLNFSSALPTGAIQVYATASGASATDCYVSFSDGTNTYTTGNLSGVNHGWVDVASGSSLSGITSVTINSGPSSSEGLSLKAIKVAGKELVDAGLIPAGSLNSSLYNQSQTWSSSMSITGSWDSGGVSAANAFDGDMSTNARSMGQNDQITFDITNTPLTFTDKVELYHTSSGMDVSVNGGTAQAPATNQFVTIASGGGTLNTITFANANAKTVVVALRVDGKLLVDANAISTPSIASTVRANPSAGFSIVTYTGTGSNASIAHGLNAAPGLVIVKKRSAAGSWTVWHQAFGTASNTDYIYLDIPNQQAQNGSDSQPFWNNTVPTSNVVSLGTGGNVNGSTATFVAYCFAPVEGYSAFGSYTGNGDANGDGPFVFTGFRPALIITKRTDANGGWVLWDTVRNPLNVATEELYPDDPSDEYTGGGIDILSNGFKLRNNSAHENNLNGSYIYIAFAEHPFKTARAR